MPPIPITSFLISTLSSTSEAICWIFILAVTFGILEKLMPCNRGQLSWREISSVTDILYWLIVPIFTRFVRIAFIGAGVFLLFHGQSDHAVRDYIEHGYGPLGTLPIWLQAAIIFIVSDIILYWTHRSFHSKALWRFHAIHHSSPKVDWLSAVRFHPVNTWFSFTLVDTLMLFAGFSIEAVSLLAIFNMFYSAMVHANLNWTFGPFKYCFSSPVFHRWHHTAESEGMNKNFAPTFPLLDHIFGTLYMPEDRLPQEYGVPGSDIPETFWGQMLWPFKQR